jgi:hypothetical protein
MPVRRGPVDVESWTSVPARSVSRTCLERQIEEGESPVGEALKRDWRYPEYRALEIAREAGRY